MKYIVLLIITLSVSLFSESSTLTQIQKIVASDRAESDQFGHSVAIDGNFAIVGAHLEGEDADGGATAQYAGSAYIFQRDDNSGTWTQVQKIVASDRDDSDMFGHSVAIDGNFAIVGAYQESEDADGNNTEIIAGSAYIFQRDDNSGTWTQVQKIVASDRAEFDQFGHSVAIDGNFAIVGALLEDEDADGGANAQDAGSAYIFERDNNSGTWSQVQKIVASDRSLTDYFGSSIAIDGNFAIVGAYQESEDADGNNTENYAGSAYIFQRDDNSGTWTQVQKIVASDRAELDQFGHSVAIDGNFAIVGANNEDEDADGNNPEFIAGSAYIFERDNNSGTWSQVQKIVASDRDDSDMFGTSVSISGKYAIVGARFDEHDLDGNNPLSTAGSAYIFERDNNNGTWSQVQKIVASDRDDSDLFGHSVAIDGNFAIVGANREDEDADGGANASNAGSAYIFGILQEPTASAPSFTNISESSASFTSVIQDGGLSTTVTFEYGTQTGNYSASMDAGVLPGLNATTSVSAVVSDLIPNTEYFARARAENSISFSLSDESKFTTNPADPQAYPVSVSNISFNSASITADLYNGNTLSSATIIYGISSNNLDQSAALGSETFTANTATFTASQSITSLDPNTQYFYAIEHQNVNTTVQSNTASFTTLPADSDIFSSSIAGLTNISATISAQVYNGNTFSSATIIYGQNNSLTLSQDFDGGLSPSTMTFTAEQTISGLLPNTTYSFAVIHGNANNQKQSITSSFTTVPNPPMMVFPPNDFALSDTEVEFLFEKVEAADEIVIQLSTDPTFQNDDDLILDTETNSDTTHFYDLLELNEEYFWRLKSRITAPQNQESVNYDSEFTEVFRFTTGAASPVLLSPADNAVNLNPTDIDLRWGGISGADSYELQVSQAPDFSGFTLTESLNETTFKLTALDGFTVYYWRIRVYIDNQPSAWSDVWQFRTWINPPATTFPVCGSSGVNPQALTFVWEPVNGGDEYVVELSENSNFDDPVQTFDNTSNTSVEAGNLELGKQYFWRVRAFNPEAIGDWSEACDFTTSPTSVREFLNEESFKVYPNPASDLVSVEVNALKGFIGTVKVHSIDGSSSYILFNGAIKSGANTIVIEINELISGKYLLELITENGTITTDLIIQK